MSDIVVGIADMKFSNNPDDVLITYALGSCIAVAIYDPKAKVGGLLHYMLPDSSLDANKAKENPSMFADTGVQLLFKSCYSLGAEKKNIITKVAGGASILDNTNYFRIGEKNIMALRKIFWRNKVFIDGEDTGKNFNRTVRLEVACGRFYVKGSNGTQKEL
ncbi:MAG: chemotaxis protein CheD [Syntrophales bacterium LBB04]|nr:chemotaxis protein CheD [Syntrophales bacterium LBB04]